MKDVSIDILSDITVHMKYARYIPELQRRETWEEIVDRNKLMHLKKYPELEPEIEEAYELVYARKVLPSMRSMQFAGKAIEVNPSRIYNCAFLPVDDYHAFSETMFLLLGGTGVGYSVQKHHVDQLPEIRKPDPNKRRRFVIGDSIEGWADAIKALMKSYFGRTSSALDFDFRDIRAKGAELVTAGGKAPGPEPLRHCINQVRAILESKKDGDKLSPLEVHDIMCHLADAVLAGGIRRAAMISLFSADDQEMITCKSNWKIRNWQRLLENGPVNEQGEPEKTYVEHIDAMGKKYYDLKIEGEDPLGNPVATTLYWVSEEDIIKHLETKSELPWYYFEPQRGRANNSVTLLRHRVTKDKFEQIWNLIQASGAGEPGFYFSNDKDWGTNPCCEIGLRPFQFCNLVEIDASTIEDQDDFNQRAWAASFIATLQAGYTDFHYLRSAWKKTTEKDALIGVSMTGIASMNVFGLNIEEAVDMVKLTNEKTANRIGINPSARLTCVKPAGTTSLVVGSSSGIHAWYGPYYLRSIRVGKNEAIYTYLSIHAPELLEDDLFRPQDTAIIRVPQKAPEGAVTRDESAIDMLERVRTVSQRWVAPGFISGQNGHNVSATVNIREDEWDAVKIWMWEHRDSYNGLSVLPFDNGTYKQAPFEAITKEEYEKRMKVLHSLDLSKVIEVSDGTNLKGEAACAGGACEVV